MTPGTAIGPFGRVTEPEGAYRVNPAITNSSISLFLGSEAMYRDTFILGKYKREDAPSLIFGRAFHCYILEPQEFILRYVTWLGGRRQGKEWEAFQDANTGRQILTVDDMETIKQMALAIDDNKPAAALIAECDREVVFRHMMGSALARQCRVDGVSPFGTIIDLKTCDSLTEFKSNFKKYGYHRQDRWYTGLVDAVTSKRHEFQFIAVEKKPPYAVGIFRASDEFRAMATDEINDAMRRLDKCLATNRWKRDEDEVQTISPRRWEAA